MMTKRLLPVAILGATLGLVGCDSLLYSGGFAPVYSKVPNPPAVVPPATIPQPTASIEKAGGQLGQSSGVIINSAQGYPYSQPTNIPTRPASVDSVLENIDNTVAQSTDQSTQAIKQSTQAVQDDAQITQQQINRPSAMLKTGSEEAKKEAQQALEKTNTEMTAPARPVTPKTAANSLLQEAGTAVKAGNYEKAASALERAHRIEPGNAKILYDIAQIRYAQGKYRQAESFAGKAANYSSSSFLSKKIWSLLSNARKALGNTTGAEAAAKKANTF
ncbi:MAG: tetratricopeptide repeat protein [Ostreibacterium sp.]